MRKSLNIRATQNRYTLFFILVFHIYRLQNKIYNFSLKYKDFHKGKLFTVHINLLILKMEK